MATGMPVVSTRHGGIPEAVTHNLNGFLTDERDVEALGRALIGIARSPDNYIEMSHAAHEAVIGNFDQEVTVRALEDVYEEICMPGLAHEQKNAIAVLPATVAESA
jgi:glycosyltransferase involved in cell wall biosynthesis